MAKLLLVDDNEMNRDMLSRRLVRKGFEVLVAEDGPRSLQLAESALPDLILMDLTLPGISGCEVRRLLKANRATTGIPVVALTAHAMSTDRDQALAAGFDEFETKPVEFARLLATIEGLLSKFPAERVSQS
jgi:two-component system cell cycle response regulator DivK